MLAKCDFFHQPEVLAQYRLHPDQDSKKPAAAIEGDALWIRMVDDRTEAEMVALAGSLRSCRQPQGYSTDDRRLVYPTHGPATSAGSVLQAACSHLST